MSSQDTIRLAFFGTSEIAVYVLDELEKAGYMPAVVVTSSDKPQGRGMVMTSSAVALWALERSIPLSQPAKITPDVIEGLQEESWDVFIVADYGLILPKALLDTPKHGTLNVHPSILPRLRGPSPIRSAILTDERETGVTVMLLDEKMDHGPIVAQRKVAVSDWPPNASVLEETLARAGGELLASILPQWIAGEIEAHEQNHDVATYCEKFEKEDGLLNLADDASNNLRKIRAYEGWPGAYAYFSRNGKKLRVKILDAHIDSDTLVIERVLPEGKREMSHEEFLRSGAMPATRDAA